MRPARYRALLRIFADLASSLSYMSTCTRLRVCCIVLSKDLTTIYGYGYNGGYKGGPNTCDSDIPGACGDLHAECNALVKVRVNDPTKIIILTHSPCKTCAKLIINSGVSKVYYIKAYRSDDGLKILKQAKIPYEKLQ